MSIVKFTDTSLRSINGLARESSDLQRLAWTNSHLSKDPAKRRAELSLLKRLWKECSNSTKPDQARDRVKQYQAKVDLKLSTYIDNLFNQIQQAENLKDLQAQFNSDTTALELFDLRQSARGNKGPTMLVSYFSQKNSSMNAYVVKWTTWNELLISSIYAEVSNSAGIGFKTVMFRGIDLESQFHFMPGEGLTSLSIDTISEIGRNYHAVSNIACTDRSPSTNQIMFSDRINGENLIDFFKSKYVSLSETQKEQMFITFAKIGLLDIVMGNLDRLNQIYDTKGVYKLEDLEVNLGNLMICWTPGNEEQPVIYTIDNGIDDDLIDSKDKREQYTLFLHNLFRSDTAVEQLSSNFARSLFYALSSQIDDSDDHNLESLREGLKPVTQDVKSGKVKSWVAKGFKEMLESEAMDIDIMALETNLHASRIMPKLIPSIVERFETYHKARKR